MLRILIFFFPLLAVASPTAHTFSSTAVSIFNRYESLNINTHWHHEIIEAVGTDEVSAEILKKRGVEQKYLDHMALEYVKLKDNLFFAVIFPPGSTQPEEARAILNKAGTVVYEKDIVLTQNGMKNFLRAVYDVHHCDGWREVNSGIYSRFKHLLNGENQTLHIILFECDSLKHSNDSKRIVRRTYDNNNEICHFTDFLEETRHIAHILMSQPTIDFLNTAHPKNYDNFVAYAKTTKAYADKCPTFKDAYCADTGAVLAAYGIRRPGDFDIIIHGKCSLPIKDLGINNHTRTKYGTNCDDIIYNPTKHFYYKGVRFVALNEVRNFKSSKNNEKDRRDILLIDKFIR